VLQLIRELSERKGPSIAARKRKWKGGDRPRKKGTARGRERRGEKGERRASLEREKRKVASRQKEDRGEGFLQIKTAMERRKQTIKKP